MSVTTQNKCSEVPNTDPCYSPLLIIAILDSKLIAWVIAKQAVTSLSKVPGTVHLARLSVCNSHKFHVSHASLLSVIQTSS